MEILNNFYKNKETDRVFWVNNRGEIGVWLFSFDKKKIFNLFEDYPHNMTSEQKRIFDEENPYWKEFFKDRQQK